MKRLIPLFLVLLLLCGCAAENKDYTLPVATTQSTATDVPPSDSGKSATPTEEKEQRLYTTYSPDETETTMFSSDSMMFFTAFYEEGRLYSGSSSILSYFDFELEKRIVLCSQPNCTHSTEDCFALISTDRMGIWRYKNGKVIAAVQDEEEQYSLISLDPSTGERKTIADLSAPEGMYRSFSMGYLLEDYAVFMTHDQKVAINEPSENHAKAVVVELSSGKVTVLREVVERSVICTDILSAAGNCVLFTYTSGGDLLPTYEEYVAQGNDPESYWEYYSENTESVKELYNLSDGTCQKLENFSVSTCFTYQELFYYQSLMDDTVNCLDMNTGEIAFVTEAPAGAALVGAHDGRLFFNQPGEGEYWNYYWYELETGELRQYDQEHQFSVMPFSLHYENEEYFFGLMDGKGGTYYIRKQDFYNENWDAAKPMFR